MSLKVFLAGATGAIGSRLLPLLREAGYEIFGATHDERRSAWLRNAGAEPIVIDVFDRNRLIKSVVAIQPAIVVSQLTDLPKQLEAGLTEEVRGRNARMRREGVVNLVDAAREAGSRRIVAQSYMPIYAPRTGPHVEADPLDEAGPHATTVAGVLAMEKALVNAQPLEVLILRCGDLYGPGTWREVPDGPGSVHVDAAAWAAMLAITHGSPGIYNIADDDGYASIQKASRELGWSPGLRLGSPVLSSASL
jgi:nucleoside-diphosphate-sugar epimerase